MEINERYVSVDVVGTRNESVRVPEEIYSSKLSFAPANDDIQENPGSPKNVYFTFKVIKLGCPPGDDPTPSDITVALKSNLQRAFLVVDPSNRRLALQNAKYVQDLGQSGHFILRPEAQPIDREDIFIGIVPADQGMICCDDGIASEVSLCLRLLNPPKGQKAVESAWLEQLAILCALEEDTESSGDLVTWGNSPKPESYLDNQDLLKKVDDMKNNGLDEAKEFLGHQYNEGNLQKHVNSVQMVNASKLLTIMCQCVYLRDLEFRRAVKKIMRDKRPIWQKLRNWIDGGNAAVPEGLPEKIAAISEKTDQALEKIQAVARQMGLNYLPLANISEADRLNANGPCCGAFYSDSDKPFIVLAFKGTSTKPECFTNIKYQMMGGNAISSLRGHFHSGFLNGLFTSVPIGLSTDKKTLRQSIPLNMLSIQINKLVKQLHAQHPEKKVQLWTTGHSLGGAYATVMWSAFQDIPRIPHSTLRDLITFGAPRIGNEEFASTIESIKEKRNIWRFVNGKDIVASVPGNSPLSGVRYIHSGFPIKLSNGRITIGKPETDSGSENPRLNTSFARVWLAIFWKITQNIGDLTGLQKFVTDHFLDSYWSSLKDASVPEEKWPPTYVGHHSSADLISY